MKARCLLILLTIFLFGCENTIFQELTGVDGETDKSSSSSTTLSAPNLRYYYFTDGLEFELVKGATEYYIYYGISPSTSNMKLKTITTSLLPKLHGDNYGIYYSVRAYDSNSGEYSDYSNVVLRDFPSLERPVLSYDSTTGYLSWNSVDAENCCLYYGSSPSISEMEFYHWEDSTKAYISEKYIGKYFVVRVCKNTLEKYSDYSNVVQIGSSSSSSSGTDSGEPDTSTPTYTWTASFVTNGGTSIASYKTSVISTKPTTTRSGYTFLGWYTDPIFMNPVNFPYTLTDDTTFYAKWSANSISAPTISYNKTSGYLSWNYVSDATDYYIYYGDSSSTSSMTLRKSSSLTMIFVGGDYYGKYYAVRAYDSNSGKYSPYSNVVLIGSGSSSSSGSDSIIKETITYTTNTELPGRYYIKWTNSGNSATNNPYLYMNDSWYGYPNNGSIQLSNGTYTFYLATSGGKRISNILTIVVTDSPYWYNHDN